METLDHEFKTSAPVLSVLGVSKSHAQRATKWLKDRSLLSFYRSADKSLNAFEFKHGRDWTYKVLNDALEAAR